MKTLLPNCIQFPFYHSRVHDSIKLYWDNNSEIFLKLKLIYMWHVVLILGYFF